MSEIRKAGAGLASWSPECFVSPGVSYKLIFPPGSGVSSPCILGRSFLIPESRNER